MEPVSERRWRIRKAAAGAVEKLMAECGLSRCTALLLANRGLAEPALASQFLSATLADLHDPLLMRGMAAGVERLAAAVRNGERVCVYGDYDVDGVTSVALLISFFRAVGLDCFYHIPNRLEEGYGLAAEGIRSVHQRGASVIVSVDCGISAVAEASLCATLGIDLIVTDHHMPGATLPGAFAVINPLQPECPFPFKGLAGVGIAFNLAVALRGRLRADGHFVEEEMPNLRRCLDLVALGTIADVVPLIDENRIFVKYGLQELSAPTRVGIRALNQVAGVGTEVSCGAVGFRLAPRLNAAGRLEDAALGVELLLTDDPTKAAAMAAELDASNAERQAVEQEILRDAVSQVRGNQGMRGNKSIVLASAEWHPGVIGIVASRLVEMFHRPTILIALQNGNGKGSGRSISGFHLYDALGACADHLLKFGGHRHAAGLAIDEATLAAFVERFEEVASGLLTAEDLQPELNIDAELAPAEVSLGLAAEISRLEPFGLGNPEPLFVMYGVQVVEQRILKERHLKLKLKAGASTFDAIGFNMAGVKALAGSIDAVFAVQENVWNGKKSVQLRLKDLREAGNREA